MLLLSSRLRFAAVEVVTNAASVTRLNLSLRLHATISKQRSRRPRAASSERAALSAASESESERSDRRTRPTLCTRLGYFCESRSVILLRHSPTIIIINRQQGQRAAEAAGRGDSSSNKMQLMREKIDDVVVRAPAPAKSTVGHTYTWIHSATVTHTCTPVCTVNTEIICVIKKPRTVSSPALSLSFALFLNSVIFFYGVYF